MSNDTFAPSSPCASHLKYVRFAKIGFVLWKRTDDLFHATLAEGVGRSPDLARVHGLVISAGFASVYKGVAMCFGKSESLGIGSLPEDARLLAEQLGLEDWA